MKIIQLTTILTLSGAERVILDLCSMPGHEFVLVGLLDGDGTLTEPARERGVRVRSLGMRSKRDPGVIARCRHVLLEERPDLVHTHLAHASFVGRLAGRWVGVPVVSTIHNVDRRPRSMNRWLERVTGRLARRVTVVSEVVRDYARRELWLPADRLEVLPNGIDTDRFAPGEVVRDIDFLFLGRLARPKGLDRILEPMRTVGAETGATLVVVGTGPDEARLRSRARELGVRVDWAGFTAEPQRWLRRARVVIVPSRSEGFGLVAAEALACGCDVVHTGVDALPGVCGPHGRVLPADESAWAGVLIEALRSFTESPARPGWVREGYGKPAMLAGFDRVYRRAVGAPD